MKKKKREVNKAIRNENTTTITHLQDLQAPRDIVKINLPYKHERSKTETVDLQNRERAHGTYHNTTKIQK